LNDLKKQLEMRRTR